MSAKQQKDSEEHFRIEFGQRFKMLRKSMNLSQEDIAKEMGVSSLAHISVVENGKKSLGIEFLSILKNKFPTINLDWLLSGKGEMLLADGNTEVEPSDERVATLEDAREKIDKVIALLKNEEES